MQFGISESYAQKRFQFTKNQLLLCLDLPHEEALKEALAGDCMAIDVTEQPIERPLHEQQRYYSEKKTPHHQGLTACLPTDRPDSGGSLWTRAGTRFCALQRS